MAFYCVWQSQINKLFLTKQVAHYHKRTI